MWTDANASAAETPAAERSTKLAEEPPAAGSAGPSAAQAAADRAARTTRSAVSTAARTLSERRGLRIGCIGAGLLVLGLLLGADDVLAVALVVVGLVLIVIGAVGPRLQGRLSLDFGPNGSLLEIKAHLAPPGKTAVAGEIVTSAQPQLTAVPSRDEPEDVTVIESHGETIELDVERLKRLLAAEDAKAAAAD